MTKLHETFPDVQVTEHGVSNDDPFFYVNAHQDVACLDDLFTAEQLEAIASWVRAGQVANSTQ